MSHSDIRDKLYDIFKSKFVRVCKGESPSFQVKKGGFSLEERKKIERKWEECLSEMGATQLGWSAAVRHDQTVGSFKDILVRNPCENPEEVYALSPSISTYILLPMELAEKILVLGILP